MSEGKAAILILRSLLEALVEHGLLDRGRAIQLLDRTIQKSAAENGTRASRKEEEAIIEAVKGKFLS
jgi:hypothetical protein